MNYKIIKTKSTSVFHSIKYNGRDLLVKFNTGGTYLYKNVNTKIIHQLKSSKSVGSFFHKEIKNNYSYQVIS